MNYYSPPTEKDSSQPTYISSTDRAPTYFNAQPGIMPQAYYQQGLGMPQATSSLQSLAAAQQLALYAQNVQQTGYGQEQNPYIAHSAANTLSGLSSMYTQVPHMQQGSNYYGSSPSVSSNPYMQQHVQQLHQINPNRVSNPSSGMFHYRGVDIPYSNAPTILRPTATPANGYYTMNYPSIPGQVLPTSSAYPGGQHPYT